MYMSILKLCPIKGVVDLTEFTVSQISPIQPEMINFFIGLLNILFYMLTETALITVSVNSHGKYKVV